MKLIEIDCKLSKDNNKFIDFMLSPNFPLYYQTSTEGYSFFGHVFMDRHEEGLEKEGRINSPHFPIVMNIVRNICSENKIDINTVYRASLNVSTYDNKRMGGLHVDHPFSHKVFLMYLNDFTEGHTFIMDEKTKEPKPIEPKKNKAIVFDGTIQHAKGFCGSGERRVTLIVTFN
jgi:hypothetical protein